MSYAFRCANCNSLADSAHAGERDRPAKCTTCGAGVTFTPDGIKSYDEDNWIVLADLSEADLAPILEYHGIEKREIKRHKPAPAESPDHEPVSINAEAVEAVDHEDKAR